MDKSDFSIRFSKEEDFSHLVSWLSEKETMRWFPMSNVQEVEDAAKHWISFCKKYSCLTAVYRGEPCGSANLNLNFCQKLQHQCILSIVVGEAYRNHGVGKRLLMELQRIAKENFFIELLHLEVYEHNPAIFLYSKLGFIEYGRHPHFIKESLGCYRNKILMQKLL